MKKKKTKKKNKKKNKKKKEKKAVQKEIYVYNFPPVSGSQSAEKWILTLSVFSFCRHLLTRFFPAVFSGGLWNRLPVDWRSAILGQIALFRWNDMALWSKTIKNPDVSTGPLACPFAGLLALLIYSLALHCLLRSHTLVCSLGGKYISRCLVSKSGCSEP